MYDIIKNQGRINIDMMLEICAFYVTDLDEKEPLIVCNPINIDDEKAFEIRYTNEHEVDPWLNYMNNTEQLANNYRMLRESIEK